jgi:hypothetical protein
MTHTEVNLGILNRDQMMAVIILMTRRLQAAYAAIGETVADDVLQAWQDHQIEIIENEPMSGLPAEEIAGIRTAAITLIHAARKPRPEPVREQS